MRTSSHQAKAIAILTAAAGLAATAQFASAQTWVSPNSGNWSTPANWIGGVVPASSATTGLLFGGTGYASNNDLANPFQFGSLTVNNSGASAINITGNPFTGGTATGGAFIFTNSTGAGASQVNNGGTLYAVRVNQGSLAFNGGNWTLASTQSGNDPVNAVNDGGFWSISVGETSGQTGRFDILNATINAQQGFWGNADGATGIGTISNSTVTFANATGRFGVNFGTGSLSLVNGAQVTGRLFEIGRQANSHAFVLVDGAATRVNAQQIVSSRSAGGTSGFTISGGAIITIDNATNAAPVFISGGQNGVGTMLMTGGSQLNQKGQQTIATGTDSFATVTINNASKWNNQGNSFISSATVAVTGDPIPANATVTVTGVGSQYNTGTIIATGTTTQSGGQQTLGVSGEGTLNILAGATSLASNTFIGNFGHGTMVVSGPGSTMTNFNQLSMRGVNDGTHLSELRVASGGVFNNSGLGFMSSQPNDRTQMDIDGGTLTVGTVLVVGGGGTNAGMSTINISNGGRLLGERLTIGQNDQNITTVNVSGANSKLSTQFGAGTGSVAAGVGANANVNINLTTGADMSTNQSIFLSGGLVGALGDPSPSGNTNLNVTGSTVNAGFIDVAANPDGRSNLNVNAASTVSTTGLGMNIADDAAAIGTVSVSGANARIMGTGTAQLVVGADGPGTLNINSGGLVNMAGNAFISAGTFSTANVNVNAGSLVMGGVAIIAGNGGNDAGNGTVTLTNGAVMTSNGMAVFPNGTFNVGTGTSAARYTSSGDVTVNGNVFYNAGTFNAAGTLGVGGNVILSSANRNAAGTPSNKKLLEVGQATLTTSGVIDLNDNDMLIHENNRQKYVNFVKAARNNGLWNQPGITSTAAKNSVPKNKGLGVLSGAEYIAVNGTPFDGKTVVATDTVIKFTYNGDTDFNGVINFDDYARTDSGFNNGRSGWLNGDFDYNGVVNFDDYSLIDQAFNTQGSTVLAAAGDPAGPGFDRTIVAIGQNGASMIATDPSMMHRGLDTAILPVSDQPLTGGSGLGGGNLNAVPEPATVGLIGLAVLGALRRRRRRA